MSGILYLRANRVIVLSEVIPCCVLNIRPVPIPLCSSCLDPFGYRESFIWKFVMYLIPINSLNRRR